MIIDSFSEEYAFLSNFAYVRRGIVLPFDSSIYPSVEHAYQAAKTLNMTQRVEICNAKSAGMAKRLGKNVVIRPDWDNIKIDLITDLLCQKFSKEPFRSKLLSTGNATLIEVNTWGDCFWGVCDGIGENNLGQILMLIREGLSGQ